MTLLGSFCVQSLWTGDKSGYKWGKRQPVRRRRGDVHGDLSAVVLRLDTTQGRLTLPSSVQPLSYMVIKLAFLTQNELARYAEAHPLWSRKSKQK